MERVTSGRPDVGTVLNLDGFGCCRVESNADPSLIALTTPAGGVMRIGERAFAGLFQESTEGE